MRHEYDIPRTEAVGIQHWPPQTDHFGIDIKRRLQPRVRPRPFALHERRKEAIVWLCHAACGEEKFLRTRGVYPVNLNRVFWPSEGSNLYLALRWLKRVRLRPDEHSVTDRPHQRIVRPSAHAGDALSDSFGFFTDALDEHQLVSHERDKGTVIRAPLQRSNRRLHRHLTKLFRRNRPIVLTLSDVKLNSSAFIACRERSLVPSHAHDFDRPTARRPFARVYRISVQHPLIFRRLVRLPLTRRVRDFARPRAVRRRSVRHDKVPVSTARRNLTRVSRRLTPRHRLVLRHNPHRTYRREHQRPSLRFALARIRDAFRSRRHRYDCLSSLVSRLKRPTVFPFVRSFALHPASPKPHRRRAKPRKDDVSRPRDRRRRRRRPRSTASV